MEAKFQQLYDAILDGNIPGAAKYVTEALDAGHDAQKILNEAMIVAMDEVGRLFAEGEYFVPEVLVSAKAMQSGLSVLKPVLVSANYQPVGKVVIGTVRGDQHDIGKNLVSMMLEGASFQVIDLGTNVAPEQFVEAVKTNQADILGMSALLTTTMPNMQETIKELNKAGLRDKVKVMIGGAPVKEAYAKEIGADGTAPDASRAVTLAKALINR